MREIVAIVQARLASTRLPGKVLVDISGKSMLEWVVDRTRRSKLVREVVVATTVDSSDDELLNFCKNRGFPVRRGCTYDVLDRYYQIAKQFNAEIIVRVTADCPLIDPDLIDEALILLLKEKERDLHKAHNSTEAFDFVTNRLPPPWGRTYPIGLDVEVFTFNLLQDAWYKATKKYQREHVAPYFYEDAGIEDLKYKKTSVPFSWTTTPKGYQVALMHHTPAYGHLRWTVDTSEDLELVRIITSHFADTNFSWCDVLRFTQCNPELNKINAYIQHKTHLDVDQRST